MRDEILQPFGPAIIKTKVTQPIVDSLNVYLDKILLNKNTQKSLDRSHALVGQVKGQFDVTVDYLETQRDTLLTVLKQQSVLLLNQHVPLLPEVHSRLTFNFLSAWVVQQLKADFNPIHWHTHQGNIAQILYLKVPEWKDESSSIAGHLTFVHGSYQPLTKPTYLVKPEVGDLYTFPSWLMHGVYPFNGNYERRSFSINTEVLNYPNWET